MTTAPAPETPDVARCGPSEATPAPEDTPTENGPQTAAQRLSDSLAAWRAAGSPILDPIAKAAANPQSRALAIAAKCYDCQGGDADPGWRWRIGNCTARCPLVPVRPHQHLAGTPAPAAIADHAEATS